MTVVLAEFQPYDPVDEAVVTLRATSHDDAEVTSLDGQTWWPALSRKGRFSMDLFDGAFTGKLVPGTGEMELDLSAFPDAARYAWAEKPARVWIGQVGDDFADYTLLFEGLTQTATADRGRLKIPLRVNDKWLDYPLLTEEYEGTGGAEGAEDLKGNPKELVIGAPKNVAPRLVDAVNNVYQLSGYGTINGTVSGFDNGSAFPASFGNYAGYAALIASGVTPGNIATSFAEGLVMLGAPGFGVITFDCEGDAAGPDGWVRLPGKVIKRLSLIAGADVAQLDTASLDALDVAVPRTISLQVKEQTPARALIQTIAQSCNAGAGVSWLGTLFVSRIAFGTSVLTLKSDGSALPPVASVRLLEVASPFWRMQMSANRSWRVHDSGELAEESGGDVSAVIETRPVTVYVRSYTKPATLTTEPGVPVGTSIIAPATGLGILWMAQSLQEVDGTVIGSWSDWVALEQYPGYRIVEHPDSSASVTTTLDSIKAGGASVPAGSKTVMAYLDEKITGPQELYFQLAHDFSDDTTKHYLHFGYVKHEGASTVLTNPLAYWAWDFFDGTTADFYEVGIYDGGGYTQGSSGSVIYDNEPFDTDVTYGIIYDGIYMHFTIDGAPIHSSYAGPGLTLHPSAMMETPPDGAINIRYKAGQPREVPIEAIQWIGPLTFLNGTMARYTPGDPGDWYAATFFTERGFAGNAVAQAFVPDADFKGAFGLHAPGPDPLEPYELDHGFEFLGDGTFRIKEDTTVKLGITAYSANDHFRVAYSGTTVTYLKNGSELASSTVSSGLTFRLSGAIYNHEDRLLNLVFAPAA